jgi:hypothetical protein
MYGLFFPLEEGGRKGVMFLMNKRRKENVQ